jgi:hypothetical protein
MVNRSGCEIRQRLGRSYVKLDLAIRESIMEKWQVGQKIVRVVLSDVQLPT